MKTRSNLGDQVRNPLLEEIEQMRDWLVEIRRTIHSYPELSFEEVETSKLISYWLNKLDIDLTTGLANTGIAGLIRGGKSGKTVAIRSDMDALPITEANQVNYSSKIKGKMHACGHDAHIAILLGVAKVFSIMREKVKGNIKFIFQPAEEKGVGAKMMVEEGILENPKVDAIFGYHVFPFLPIGKVGVYMREGLAATDRFTIVIIGKGGHGGYPQFSKDPIIAASNLVTQIHSIIGRNIDPLDWAVLSIGAIRGGTAFNIIPGEVEILGTIRSFKFEVREKIKRRIEEMTKGIAFSFGMEYRFECDGHPAVINDPDLSKLVMVACSKGIGENNVEILRPSMGGEDFAYYLEKCPGAFFRLGTRNEKEGIMHSFHSDLFNIDERVLPIGVEMIVRIINAYMGLDLF